MRTNTCMGTINGTSVDRFIVDDADILVLTCTKTWSEYMNMHAVNTCKQCIKYTCTCVLQVCHKINTLESTMFCAHDEEYAHEYLHGNN